MLLIAICLIAFSMGGNLRKAYEAFICGGPPSFYLNLAFAAGEFVALMIVFSYWIN